MIDSIKKIYQYSGLIKALTFRFLATRYRGSFLGFFWTLLNPLCFMMVYWLVFKDNPRFQTQYNYTVFLLSGLLPWIWFQSGINEGISSIAQSGHLITKSMFPALILPLVAVLTGLINYILSFFVSLIIIWIVGEPLHWTLFLLPIPVFFQFLIIYGISLVFSTLNVFFRDIQHVVGNLLFFLFFLLPILYIEPSGGLHQIITKYNPVAELISMYHQVILVGQAPTLKSIVILSVFSLVCLAVGNLVYTKNQEKFSELL